ncbi:hypothetical protein F3Y22_tig00110403pilonHSYRG00104 [Hibiscus syriacus]|uniref:Expansin-like EG45 domain-containing protein n=1 Tax=Hibiscus syriacus TaxID=106335 RepID=A0A6A3AQU9_HIBSY|nr:hypothetical protein F3Y22_tig00110403pilonHSYRG00104 [Hibiscus syriacus]
MVARVNDVIWNNGAACNTNYRVRCIGPAIPGVPLTCRGESVVVKVGDRYHPLARQNPQVTIDLSEEAFAVIADTDGSRINIVYDR